jgi:hypothetical protein
MARAKKRQGKPDYRVTWFLYALSALAFGFGAWGAFNGAQTLKWPRAAAEIVDANLTYHEQKTRDVQRPDHWNTFAVHYLYSVDGKTYLGGGIEPYDFNMQNSAGAAKMADTYKAGATVQIAYDPKNPAEAYLIPGPSSMSLMLLGLGAAFVLFGLLARRMIRLGPGSDEDDAGGTKKTKPVRKPVELDPDIASFYPKPGAQPQP